MIVGTNFKKSDMTHMGAVTVTVNTDCYTRKIYNGDMATEEVDSGEKNVQCE